MELSHEDHLEAKRKAEPLMKPFRLRSNGLKTTFVTQRMESSPLDIWKLPVSANFESA